MDNSHDSNKPVAWILKCGEQQELWWEKPPFGDAIALHTSPQPAQRTWVGLTPEQRQAIAEANNTLVDDDLFDAIESLLKEKNT